MNIGIGFGLHDYGFSYNQNYWAIIYGPELYLKYMVYNNFAVMIKYDFGIFTGTNVNDFLFSNKFLLGPIIQISERFAINPRVKWNYKNFKFTNSSLWDNQYFEKNNFFDEYSILLNWRIANQYEVDLEYTYNNQTQNDNKFVLTTKVLW